jgi:NAD-reducing hydrogenase small subunit
MRKRCKLLVALGDCAVFGGVPAMRNFFPLGRISAPGLYVETESTDAEGMIPSDPRAGSDDQSPVAE